MVTYKQIFFKLLPPTPLPLTHTQHFMILWYLVFICIKQSQFWTSQFDFLHKIFGSSGSYGNVMDMVLGTQVPSDPLSTNYVVIHVVYKTKLTEITQQEKGPLKSAYHQPTFICHIYQRLTAMRLLFFAIKM